MIKDKDLKLITFVNLSSEQKEVFGTDINLQLSSCFLDNELSNTSSVFKNKQNYSGENGLLDGGNYWIKRTDLVYSDNGIKGFSIDYKCFIARVDLICQKYSDIQNICTMKNSDSSNLFRNSQTFTLSNEFGMICGTTHPFIDGSCKSYTNSLDIWTSKSSLSGTNSISSGGNVSLTSNLGFIGGGIDILSHLTTETDRFNLSSNSWTTRSVLTYSGSNLGSFSLTSDLCIFSNLHTTTNKSLRYSDSLNTWTSILDYPISTTNLACGFTLSSNFGILSGGSINTSLFSTYRYSNNENIWSSKNPGLEFRRTHFSSSLSSEHGCIAGGLNIIGSLLYSIECFHNGTSYLQTSLGISSFNLLFGSSQTCPVPSDKNQKIITNILKEQSDKIYSILVSPIIEKKDNDTQDPYYGVSFDDGETWKDGIGFDNETEIFGIKPCNNGTYKLKLKFSLFNNSTSNIWSSKTSSPNSARGFACGFSLSSNVCLVSGGQDGSGYYNICESISDSENSWTNKTVQPFSGSIQPVGIILSNDIGVLAGGLDSGGNKNTTYNFSNSSNIWMSRSNLLGDARFGCASLSMTTDTAFLGGGKTATFANYLHKFNNSINSWTSINTMRSLSQVSGITLTYRVGLLCGGENGGPLVSYNYNTEFNYSTNVLTDKTVIPYTIHSHGTFSLNSDSGIIAGGSNSPSWGVGPTNSCKFSLSSNSWTSLEEIPFARDVPSAMTIDSGSGLLALGALPSSYLTDCIKYNLGETNLLGFSCLIS